VVLLRSAGPFCALLVLLSLSCGSQTASLRFENETSGAVTVIMDDGSQFRVAGGGERVIRVDRGDLPRSWEVRNLAGSTIEQGVVTRADLGSDNEHVIVID
jgi:hypothetical protein